MFRGKHTFPPASLPQQDAIFRIMRAGDGVTSIQYITLVFDEQRCDTKMLFQEGVCRSSLGDYSTWIEYLQKRSQLKEYYISVELVV